MGILFFVTPADRWEEDVLKYGNDLAALGLSMVDYRDKSVAVTGAASGIGRCVSELLVALGAHVTLLDLNEARCAAARDEINSAGYTGSASAQTLDVTDRGRCLNVFAAIVSAQGPFYGLVTCAGIVKPANEGWNTPEELSAMLQVNLFGTVHCIEAAFAQMKPVGSGSIVAVGSVAGRTAIRNRPGYCASKAALRGWCSTMAPALRGHGVRLNTVSPGRVLTDLVRNWVQSNADPVTAFRDGCSTQCSGTMLLPEDVAREVIWLLGPSCKVSGTDRDLSDGWAEGFQPDPNGLPQPTFDEFRALANTTLGMTV